MCPEIRHRSGNEFPVKSLQDHPCETEPDSTEQSCHSSRKRGWGITAPSPEEDMPEEDRHDDATRVLMGPRPPQCGFGDPPLLNALEASISKKDVLYRGLVCVWEGGWLLGKLSFRCPQLLSHFTGYMGSSSRLGSRSSAT